MHRDIPNSSEGIREKFSRARTLFIKEPGDEAINLLLVYLVHPSRRHDRARSVVRAPRRAFGSHVTPCVEGVQHGVSKNIRVDRKLAWEARRRRDPTSARASAPTSRPSHPLALGGGVIICDGRRDQCRRSSNSAPRWRCARLASPHAASAGISIVVDPRLVRAPHFARSPPPPTPPIFPFHSPGMPRDHGLRRRRHHPPRARRAQRGGARPRPRRNRRPRHAPEL